MIVLKRTGGNVAWHEPQGHLRGTMHVTAAASPDCPPEAMGAEDPVCALHLRPPAVSALHTTAATWSMLPSTFKYVFDYHEEYQWCTADVGWVTGQFYLVYGPSYNGATNAHVRRCRITRPPTVRARWWTSIRSASFILPDRVIRAPMAGAGKEAVEGTSRTSLAASWGRWVNPSTRKPGSGTTAP